jgi:hypothetical protein
MKNVAIVAIMIIAFASCSPVNVASVSKLSPKAAGKNYKTYNIGGLEMKSKPGENFTKNLQRVVAAIDREMVAKGFQRGPVDPDLLINMGYAVTDEVQTRETTIQEARYHVNYYGGRNYGWQAEEVVVDEYQDGHVVLDFVDTKQNEMIWQGHVKGTLTESQTKMEKRINAAFKLLFRKFPLKAN